PKFRVGGRRPQDASWIDCNCPDADNLMGAFGSSEERTTVLHESIRVSKACAIVLGLSVCFVSQAAVGQGPCEQIKSACKNAGFVQGGVSGGNGLWKDCIDPIMQGTAQRHKASKPLPQVGSQLVAACKAQNSSFGQPKAPATVVAP